jgi:hypothetical protein
MAGTENDKSHPPNLKTKSPPMPVATATREDNGILTLRYEETKPAKPPLAVTVPPPRQPPTEPHPALRSEEERKRDSGLAPTTSSKAREGSVNTVGTIEENALGVKINFDSSPAQIEREVEVPATPSKSPGEREGSMHRWMKAVSRKSSTPQTPTSKEEQRRNLSAQLLRLYLRIVY